MCLPFGSTIIIFVLDNCSRLLPSLSAHLCSGVFFSLSIHRHSTSHFILITFFWERKESQLYRSVLYCCLLDRSGIQVLIVVVAHGIQCDSTMTFTTSHQPTFTTSSPANHSFSQQTLSTYYMPDTVFLGIHL